jgi:DNA topoisomerase-6 subunit B
VGRKLGVYLRRRVRVRQEGERRNVFLRYLGEVATAVSQINGTDRGKLYEKLLTVARKRTAEADVKLDKYGRPIDDEGQDLGDHVLIVDPAQAADQLGNGGGRSPGVFVA